MQAEATPRPRTMLFGPLLMIVFGVVLAMTPLASVSGLGTVGNAGSAGKGPVDCIPAGGGNVGNAGATGGLPECEDEDATTTTPEPSTTTTNPSAGVIDRIICEDGVAFDQDGNALGGFFDEDCADDEDVAAATVVESTVAAALPDDTTPAQPGPTRPAAPAPRQPQRLPDTGADGRSLVLVVAGLAFAGTGLALLLAGRRTAAR